MYRFGSVAVIFAIFLTISISALEIDSKRIDAQTDMQLTHQAYKELMRDPDFLMLKETMQGSEKKSRESKIPLDQRFLFYITGTVLEGVSSQELLQDEDFLAAFALNLKEEAERHSDALESVNSKISNQYLRNLCTKMADELDVSGSWSGSTVDYWMDKSELMQNRAVVAARKCQIIFRLTGGLEAHGQETVTYGPLNLVEGDIVSSSTGYVCLEYISNVLTDADNFSFNGDHGFWKEVYQQFLFEAERISEVLNDIAPYFEAFEAGIECAVSGEEMKGYILDQRPDETSTSSNYWMNLADDASEYLEDTGERLSAI